MIDDFMNNLLDIQNILNLFSSSRFIFDDLTFAQCKMIVAIYDNQGISLNVLSEILDIDQSTVSRTLQKCVAGEYILRCEDKDDRRAKVLVTTDKGNRLVAGFKKGQLEFFKKVFSEIDANERLGVDNSLKTVKKALFKTMKSCEGGCK